MKNPKSNACTYSSCIFIPSPRWRLLNQMMYSIFIPSPRLHLLLSLNLSRWAFSIAMAMIVPSHRSSLNPKVHINICRWIVSRRGDCDVCNHILAAVGIQSTALMTILINGDLVRTRWPFSIQHWGWNTSPNEYFAPRALLPNKEAVAVSYYCMVVRDVSILFREDKIQDLWDRMMKLSIHRPRSRLLLTKRNTEQKNKLKTLTRHRVSIRPAFCHHQCESLRLSLVLILKEEEQRSGWLVATSLRLLLWLLKLSRMLSLRPTRVVHIIKMARDVCHFIMLH